jgi:hypothetical protein
MQPWIVPSSDETPITDANSTAEVDVMLQCYEGFRRRDPELGHLGLPSIVSNPRLGNLLRADFTSADKTKVHRFACMGNGSSMQEEISVPPLYPPDRTSPDAATQRAVAAWIARKKAEEIAETTAPSFPPPDARTVHDLEGIWLEGKPAGDGPCVSNWYGYKTQIEFEFRTSGGLVQIFEPPDLFTILQVLGVRRDGDLLSLQGVSRDGTHKTVIMQIRVFPDHLEFQHTSAQQPGQTNEIAYRCGTANPTVNDSVSAQELAEFTPPVSGGWTLLAEQPGIANKDTCRGNIPKSAVSNAYSLQLELYGPVHYWVFGYGFPTHRNLVFDYVRGMHAQGDHVLRLDLQKHLEKGAGWDVPDSRGDLYQLTLIDEGDHIRIPELAMNFAKCTTEDKGSVGMHRL